MSVATELEARPFSAELRASTRVVHERANHSTYMNALLGGELSLAGYTQLAIQYFFIYQAIERATDAMTGDPVGGEFVFDELRRLPALERDLAHLVGPDWRSTVRPLASTEAYTARVAEAAQWAGGYVAHHYTRYLGDIAGGQIIRRLVEKKFDLAEAGSLFYHFDDLGSAPAFRDRYRAKLDAAPWDDTARARVIDETLVAFEHNVAVFDELALDLARYRIT
ncbi:heme oxygenase (biliverdin-producing) [Amycolatopsis sp. FDAARGOS 1241]|uniref:biliverdin-producing heme oxygenase n=1 Tax=Amycolatopsis sp. FDAARGOS 1241 TaxID=2778070 RepID=UPI00194FE64B|nr:biliverdin-producing heme oxygenase [Amycolatopsis sp. FDAARGOS 1241]QRP46785.1 biliverdin-producing heme oxygenase [Amycolatopsis sp. FDAARGOS 1241]